MWEQKIRTQNHYAEDLILHFQKHSSLGPGMVLYLFLQQRAQIWPINDTFSILPSYIQRVSPCLIFTEVKLKINATKLLFLITVAIVATIRTSASQRHFPLPCAHKIQTLIILKISNTI